MPSALRVSDRAWLPGSGNPLTRLLALRRLEVLSQSLVLALAVVWLRMPLPVLPMAAIIASLALANLLSRWWLTQRGAVGESGIFGQLAIDTLAFGLLLYFAGGSANPFVSLLLMPPMLAAAMLPTRQAWAMALLALLTYSVLLLWNLPLPAPQRDLAALDELLARVSGDGAEHALHGNSFALHVLGMWLNFVISLAVVALLLTRLASTLKRRERELAAAREAALHDEQILALGTLAAGAAHQLGTPLATMAVVLGELEHTHADDEALQQDLSLLRGQVDRCKQTLSQILASAGQTRGEALHSLAIDAYLRQLLDDWQLIRPRTAVDARLDGVSPAPTLVADGTLAQALLNLLDNAADAHGEQSSALIFTAEWSDDQCQIEILDRGPGLQAAAVTLLGEAFFTTRSASENASATAGGVGIGLFLSNATIQRFGGRVELFNRDATAGACTRVTLPLNRPKEP
ncbi:MAG: ATP-binding protein [Candidatus Accumulibacter sp.]|nr:ATP-binding protein [Accumulibacter sp.]